LESVTEEGNAVEKAVFQVGLHTGFGWVRDVGDGIWYDGGILDD
jgi:hypothetical protein